MITQAEIIVKELVEVHSPFMRNGFNLDYPQIWYRENGEWTEYPHQIDDPYLLIRSFGLQFLNDGEPATLDAVVLLVSGWGAPVPMGMSLEEMGRPSESDGAERVGVYYGVARDSSVSCRVFFASGDEIGGQGFDGDLAVACEWLGMSLWKREWASGVLDLFRQERRAAVDAGFDDLEEGRAKYYAERVAHLLDMVGHGTSDGGNLS